MRLEISRILRHTLSSSLPSQPLLSSSSIYLQSILFPCLFISCTRVLYFLQSNNFLLFSFLFFFPTFRRRLNFPFISSLRYFASFSISTPYLILPYHFSSLPYSSSFILFLYFLFFLFFVHSF